MIAAALLAEEVGPPLAGRLHNDDAADALALLIGVVDEQVGEAAQELATADLKNRFGKRAHDYSTFTTPGSDTHFR